MFRIQLHIEQQSNRENTLIRDLLITKRIHYVTEKYDCLNETILIRLLYIHPQRVQTYVVSASLITMLKRQNIHCFLCLCSILYAQDHQLVRSLTQ